MVRWKRDIIYGVVFLMFCIVNFIYSRSIEQTAIEVTLARPDVYLNLWLSIFALLSSLMIIKAVRKRPSEVLKPILQKLTVTTIVLFTLYLLVLPHIGFLISTAIILCALFIVYGLEGNEKTGKDLTKQIIKWIIIAVIIALLAELLFRNVLYVRLPSFKLF